MKAWKLFSQKKNGEIGPLFINRKQRIPENVWLPAEAHLTKGFAFRPGWHVTLEPIAPHLSEKGRVWRQVEVEDFETYQRPESQGGTWVLAKRMKLLPNG